MKKLLRHIIVLISVVIIYPSEIKGQGFILSQPYNNTTILAPSFAGMTNGGRIAFSYRNQWPGLNNFNTFVTYIAAFDYFLAQHNSGIGAFISNDVQAAGLLRTVEGALQYNYRVRLNNNLFFRPGIQVQFTNRTIDFGRHIFSGNIAVDGSIINSGVPFNIETDSYTKLDASFSSLLYNRNFWLGFNIDHLIPSNVSFLNQNARTPLRYSIMGGYSFIYRQRNWRNPNDESITLSFLLQRQGQFSQMDFGATWTKSILQLGLSYRGFFPVSTITGRDALIFALGANLEQFKVVYSYDVSLSALHNVSGGSHEISLQFFFNQQERSPTSFFCR